MIYQKCLTAILVFLSVISLFSQVRVKNTYRPDDPILFKPTNHDPSFKDFPEKSFYESRNNWQAIIDSTWGSGLPLANKLAIFDHYAITIRSEFDGFASLGLTLNAYDILTSYYRSQINDFTSRGAFSTIMSQLAHALKDIHTAAYDKDVNQSALNPGVPLLVLSSYVTIEHFGGVLTVLPDSNLLVLRVVPNHPLNLQPGDIILGYEGIPWKNQIYELLSAGLPFIPGRSIGAPSAYSDFHLISAGMNWHLFNTINVLKYSTGDTVHLSVAPMVNLNIPPMLNNEQLEIPGIPFPDIFNDQVVTYGILNNTNIGYIYLFEESPTNAADQQFAQAVTALQNTEGLIIDMRLNYGGWALFDAAFNILFNDYTLTIEDAVRSSPSSITLVPAGNANWFEIDGNPASLYDHPIAVLLGPTCVSMGDLTAQRFRYHPTVRFFGKAPAASLGDNSVISSYPDWYLSYSWTDMFHVNKPGSYLNRMEFPIDYPVWHNPDDVANGIDAVVDSALGWMNNLVYAHDLTIEKKYCSPSVDTLRVEALVENPNAHHISSTVYINNLDSTFIDSLRLSREILTSEAEIWSGAGPAPPLEDHFILSISAYDSMENEEFMVKKINRFTTIGPIVFDSLITYDGYTVDPVYEIPFKIVIKNNGSITTANNIRMYLSTSHPKVTGIVNNNQSFGDIMAGQSIISPDSLAVQLYGPEPVENIALHINFYSDDFIYWQDSTDMLVGIKKTEKNNLVPNEFTLNQNYPNPFNPSTTINFDLPKTSDVTLKIFNILGEEVATLVSDRLSTGSYTYKWDSSNLASGVYLYRLQAGDYVETRKMILMR